MSGKAPIEPIFVIHRDDDDRMELCEALEEHGWDPIPFENAEAALAALDEHPALRFVIVDRPSATEAGDPPLERLRRRHLARGGAVVVVDRERLADEARRRELSPAVEEALSMARSFAEHPPRLLVVDDEPSVRRLCSELFSPRFEVLTAASGDAALEALQRAPVDLLVIDEHLPGISGAELVRQIRGHGRVRSYVMISGDPAAREAATGVGVAIFVGKPFSVDVLERAVEAALRIPHAIADTEPPRL